MFYEITSMKEVQDLISKKKEALERNAHILADLDNLTDEEYKSQQKAQIQETIDRLESELVSLEKRESELKPNDKIIEEINKYDALEEEKKELINRRERQERELESLQANVPEETTQEYYTRLNELDSSIKSIDKHIERINEELEDLDKTFEFYSNEEIVNAVQAMEQEEKEEVKDEVQDIEEEIPEKEINKDLVDLLDDYFDLTNERNELVRKNADKMLIDAIQAQIDDISAKLDTHEEYEIQDAIEYIREQEFEQQRSKDKEEVKEHNVEDEYLNIEENQEKTLKKEVKELVELQETFNDLFAQREALERSGADQSEIDKLTSKINDVTEKMSLYNLDDQDAAMDYIREKQINDDRELLNLLNDYFDLTNKRNELVRNGSDKSLVEDTQQQIADIQEKLDTYDDDSIQKAIEYIRTHEAEQQKDKEEVKEHNVEDEYMDINLERAPRMESKSPEDDYIDLGPIERQPRTERSPEDEYIDLDLGEREPRTEIVGAEINEQIAELEKEFFEACAKGDEAQEEVLKHAKELNSAYTKQIRRFESLIKNNDGEEPEYAEYLTTKIDEAIAKQSGCRELIALNDALDEDIEEPEIEENLSEERINDLEQETIEAQLRINELEEELEKALKNKRFFDEQAISICEEMMEKNQEYIELLTNNEELDIQKAKKLEYTQAKDRLGFAKDKQREYQERIDKLQEEIEKNTQIIENNQEELSRGRESIQNEEPIVVPGIDGTTPDDGSDNGSDDDSGNDSNEEPANDTPETSDDDQNNDSDDDQNNDSDDNQDEENGDDSDDDSEDDSDDNGNDEDNDFVDDGDLGPIGIEGQTPQDDHQEEEEKDPEEKEPIEENKEMPKKKGRVLEVIKTDIITDKETGEPINVTHIQRKRLERSEISITRNFGNQVKNGQVIYNVTSIASAVWGLLSSTVQKLSGKLLTTKRTKEKFEKVRQNIQDLPDEDKEVLFNEYINIAAASDRDKGIDGIIREEAIKYKRETVIKPKVEEAGRIFTEIMESYKLYKKYGALVEQLEDGLPLEVLKQIPGVEIDVDGITREQLIGELKTVQGALIQGKAEKIKRFQELNKELSKDFNGTGIHALEEEEKAKSSMMNEKGKRFARDVGTGEDFEGRKMRAEVAQALSDSLDENKDLESMLLFVKGEQLKYQASKQGLVWVRILKGNPLIPEGIPIIPAGIGEVGTVNYAVLAHEMDYRPDPFIRNMITTVATVATIAHTIGAIQHNIEVRRGNEANQGVMDEVHARGKQLEDHDKELAQGMEHQREGDFTGYRNHDEMRDDFWDKPADYTTVDTQHHMGLRQSYETVTQQVQDIQSKMQSGQLSTIDGLDQIRQLNLDTHTQYVELLKETLPKVEEYAANHPEFDYNVLIPAMKKMIENPSALDAENQALLDAIQQGGALQQLVVEEIPQSIIAPIIGIAGATLITAYTASQSQKGFEKPISSLEELVGDSIELDQALESGEFIEEPELEEEKELEEEEEKSMPIQDEPEEEPSIEIETEEERKERDMKEMLGEYAPEEREPIEMEEESASLKDEVKGMFNKLKEKAESKGKKQSK